MNTTAALLTFSLLFTCLDATNHLQQQHMYRSYLEHGQGPSKKGYKAYISAIIAKNQNRHIPRCARSHLRVMTYNIHLGEDMDGKDNTDGIEAVIRDVDPDVIFFQGVRTFARRPGQPFHEMLKRMKYADWNFARHTITKGEQFGNMVVSKFPVHSKHNTELPDPFNTSGSPGRSVAHSTIILSQLNGIKINEEIHLVSAHFRSEKSNRTRLEHARFIQDRLNILSPHGLYIIGGDLSATPISQEVLTLSDGFCRTPFQDLQWTSPKFTCWTGNTVDYLIAGSSLAGETRGAYVYYSLASDHLPIIADYDVTPLGKNQESFLPVI